jgi:hypothetical protein
MITLSEYLGFIFIEITNARVMADKESARIAEMYSQNPLFEKFSVPRFKIPEMELSIPVVISGAKYTSTIEFTENKEGFIQQIKNELSISVKKLMIKRKLQFSLKEFKDPIIFKPQSESQKGRIKAQDNTEDADFVEFYQALKTNPSPDRHDEIVTIHYSNLFSKLLEEKKMFKDYNELYPKNELMQESLQNVNKYVESKTIVQRNKIDNLLVNPETNVIREEASDLSVFNIKAKITEEGIFVKTVRDKTSNKVISAEVDFD